MWVRCVYSEVRGAGEVDDHRRGHSYVRREERGVRASEVKREAKAKEV